MDLRCLTILKPAQIFTREISTPPTDAYATHRFPDSGRRKHRLALLATWIIFIYIPLPSCWTSLSPLKYYHSSHCPVNDPASHLTLRNRRLKSISNAKALLKRGEGTRGCARHCTQTTSHRRSHLPLVTSILFTLICVPHQSRNHH